MTTPKKPVMICTACSGPMTELSRAKMGGVKYDFHTTCPKKKKQKSGSGFRKTWNGFFKNPRNQEQTPHHKMVLSSFDRR